MVIGVGGADQREILFVGNGKEYPAIFVLEDIGAFVLEQAWHNEMAAADEPNIAPRRRLNAGDRRMNDLVHPGSGGIDQRARADSACFLAISTADLDFPDAGAAYGPGHSAARFDPCAKARGVHRIEHHQPRIVHPAVGILETLAKTRD